MKNLLAHIRFHTRWQIYGRVAPAVAVAVLATGAIGWLGYGHWTRQATAEKQAGELGQLAATLHERAVFEAVALEALRAAGPELAPSALRPAARQAAVGVVLPGAAPDGGPAIVLGDVCAGEANRQQLDAWWSAGAGARRGAPRAVRTDGAALEAAALAPLTLASSGGPQRGRLAVLPVTVRRDGECRLVALLDLARLMPAAARELDWWCLVGVGGEVLVDADGMMRAGTCLADAADDRGRVGPGLPTVAVAGLADANAWHDQRVTGSLLDPWIVGGHRDPALPLTIVAAAPTHHLLDLALICFAGIMAVALLALIVALAGTSRVVDGVSSRLTALGANMEALARGDYTRRMPRGADDEVGRLVGYFNTMAASLEEAHRQVQDKAAHLKAALENMRMLDRAKDDFLVLISHEVRTPLTAVLGGVAYLRSAIAKAAPAERAVLERLQFGEIADVIASSGERLNGFMTDAIQMTAIQSGERRLELAPVAPAELLADSLARVGPWAENRGISIACELDGDAPWRVLCDRAVLHVAVQKILDNAVVHNLDGGRVVVREVAAAPGFGEAAALATPDQVHRLHEQPAWREWREAPVAWRLLEIHNTGRAIPRDRIDALFGKFELVGRIEHHSRGSGLSLPIAKAAVEQHGGRILVHSEEGWGTAFYLLLPTVAAADAARRPRLWDDAPEGVGRRSRHEEVGVGRDRARLEVELDDPRAARPGRGHEPGGGPDGARGADHEEELTV